MEPLVHVIITESGERICVAGNTVEVHAMDGKKSTTRQAQIDPMLLCERINVRGKWELVMRIEYPKCE